MPESIRHCHLCAFGKYPSWDFFLRHMKHRHNITISKVFHLLSLNCNIWSSIGCFQLRQEQCQARKSDANSTVSTFEEFPIEFTLDCKPPIDFRVVQFNRSMISAEGFIIQTRAHYCRLCKCFFELKSENFRQHCLSAEHTAKIFVS